MNVVFLGPPNSGKGTQAKRIAKELEMTYVSSSGLFFEAEEKGLEYGKKAVEFINAGKPVPNDIAIGVLIERLTQPDCINGFIFDTPYNAGQAEALDNDERTKIDVAINIIIPEEIIIKRGSSRITCKKCKWIYNTVSLKPEKEGICDKCGGELFQREDDKPEKIKVRLVEYKERAEPLIDYYRNKGIVKDIEWRYELVPEGDVDIPPEVFFNKILEILKEFQ